MQQGGRRPLCTSQLLGPHGHLYHLFVPPVCASLGGGQRAFEPTRVGTRWQAACQQGCSQ
eukprot:13551979-Alexandrium_andersonii.AAC.1